MRSSLRKGLLRTFCSDIPQHPHIGGRIMKKALTFTILALTMFSFGCLTTKPYNSSPEYTSPPEYAEHYTEPVPIRPVSRPPVYTAPPTSRSLDGTSAPNGTSAPYGAPVTDPSILPANNDAPAITGGQMGAPAALPNQGPVGPVPNPSHKLVPKPIAPAPAQAPTPAAANTST